MTPTIVLSTFSSGLYQNKSIIDHFNAKKIILNPKAEDSNEIDLVIGWGRKPNTITPREYAASHQIPYITLEDGFIHSMGQGRLGSNSCSLITDRLGVFYDAKSTSDLEQHILNSCLSAEDSKRTNDSINLIIKHGITKYNNAKQIIPDTIKQLKNPVLVVDQVAGDMSIPYSLANKQSFNQMLSAAIIENPDTDILIKIHPDVVNGKRKGCININQLPSNIHLVSENLNPIRLMDYVSKVYVVSSQLGFEALLLKKPVVCFGIPFYAGWGLTDDRAIASSEAFQRRNKPTSLENIFHAAYYEYSYYFHPDTQSSCTLEDILKYISHQYAIQSRFTGKIFCLGFSPWKKRFIAHYLKTPDNRVLFVKTATQALKKGLNSESTICLWSFRYEEEAQKLKQLHDVPIWKIEDGFIRSVTLGSNYAPPGSLIIDKSGLYFDSSQQSDLESILSNTIFKPSLIRRAQELKQQLIKQAVSKYNEGERGASHLFSKSNTKKVILIPGQVSDDASILKGCKDINDNLTLMKTVRESNPTAYLVYKPHPDVLSGNRDGDIDQTDVLKICDQIITSARITDCISQADEVHTMTSLVGFEALMRGLKVYCYGVPFYSNWGLTIDRHPCPRRHRTLTIDELVAGTLITYPLYMNWNTKDYTTPENIADTIHEYLQLKSPPQSRSLFYKKITKKINLLKAMINPRMK